MHTGKIWLTAALLFSTGMVITGCKSSNKDQMHFSEEDKDANIARVVLAPTKGNKVRGVVTFTVQGDGVRVIGDIEGLTPGEHGFHIHEKGDCSAPDASSAGAHFNPTHKKHGGPDDPERHVGDLGNIVANAQGYAHYDRVDHVITLKGETSIIGKAVIVHSDKDHYDKQPAGDAGSRVACGVIEALD